MEEWELILSDDGSCGSWDSSLSSHSTDDEQGEVCVDIRPESDEELSSKVYDSEAVHESYSVPDDDASFDLPDLPCNYEVPDSYFNVNNWQKPINLRGKGSVDGFISNYFLHFHTDKFLKTVNIMAYKQKIHNRKPRIGEGSSLIVRSVSEKLREEESVRGYLQSVDPTTLRIQTRHSHSNLMDNIPCPGAREHSTPISYADELGSSKVDNVIE